MFAEANPAEFTNVTQVMLGYMLEQSRRMQNKSYAPLQGWAAARWIDMALGAEWMLDNAPQGKEAELMTYLKLLHDQGSNWEQWFETFTVRNARFISAPSSSSSSSSNLRDATVHANVCVRMNATRLH